VIYHPKNIPRKIAFYAEAHDARPPTPGGRRRLFSWSSAISRYSRDDFFTFLSQENQNPGSTLLTEILGVKPLLDQKLQKSWRTLKCLRARPCSTFGDWKIASYLARFGRLERLQAGLIRKIVKIGEGLPPVWSEE
jgi:hypothetical protein